MFYGEKLKEKLYRIIKKTNIIEIILVIFTIFSIFTKAIYLQYTIKLVPPPFTLLNDIAHYTLLTSIILVLSIVFWVPNKFKGILFIINILVSILLFSDALYGRYYGIPLTIPILYQIGFVDDITQSIFSLLRIKDIVFFIDLPILGLLIFLIKDKKVKRNRRTMIIRNAIIVAVILLSVSRFKAMSKNVDRSRHAYERKNMAKDFGTLYFHGFDIYDFTKQKISKNTPLSDEELNIIKDFYKNKDNSPSKYFGTIDNKNLIVIQVEAMQQFVVDLEIEGREVTPFLNRLKNNSFYFNNIYHQVAGGNTSDAEFLLNNSLYPAITGAVNYLYPTNEFLSLGKIMRDRGYIANSFHGYESSFWNREVVYRNYGYNKFYGINDFEINEKRGWAISDRSFFEQALDISLKNDKFYSFLITLSSHHPYDAFSDIELHTGKFEGTQVGNYLKSMYYVDSAIESLFNKLEESGELNNTVIVIYGDHSGLYQDQRSLVEDLLNLDGSNIDWLKIQKVPLWIYTGSELEGRTIDKVGGQIDILPTILDLYGINHPYALGNSLLVEDDGSCLKRDGTVILKDYYYDNIEKVLYDMNTNELVENSIVMEAVKEKQKELIVSDTILKKDLINNNKLLEIISN